MVIGAWKQRIIGEWWDLAGSGLDRLSSESVNGFKFVESRSFAGASAQIEFNNWTNLVARRIGSMAHALGLGVGLGLGLSFALFLLLFAE